MAGSGIDIVITWVDDNDEVWRSDRDYWRGLTGQTAYSDNLSSSERYRDWGTLPFIFRGIERYTPWVDRVFFVTYGHLPDWLDTSCNRLIIVNHEDFIPKNYLPTFSSVAIEYNLSRIVDLSERFVYFNDDTFVIDKMNPSDFFVGDLPVLIPAESPTTLTKNDMFFTQMVNAAVINSHFSKRHIQRRDWYKWLSFKLPLQTRIENIIMSIYPTFKALEDEHVPSPYLKSTIDELWRIEPKMLEYVCSEKFRVLDGTNLWLAKCWHIAKGAYVPGRRIGLQYPRRGTDFESETEAICKAIVEHRWKTICIGEQQCTKDQFESRAAAVKRAFSTILPDKSSFEKTSNP